MLFSPGPQAERKRYRVIHAPARLCAKTIQAEADHIGLLMMAEGCYRPEAAMEFWNRMEKLGQQGPPQILSTHPSNHNREAKIREWLPQAHEKAATSDCHATSNYGELTAIQITMNWTDAM
jgi:predicted Zn-dependent protease